MISNQFDDLFQNSGSQYGIDPDLLKAQAYVESGLDPNAKSSDSSATGISQFISQTAKNLGVDPTDPKSSIDGQARLLTENFKRYGKPDMAIAAYNGGTDPDAWDPSYVRKVTDTYQQLKKNNPAKANDNLVPQDDFEKEVLGYNNQNASQPAKSTQGQLNPQDDFEKEVLGYNDATQKTAQATQPAKTIVPTNQQDPVQNDNGILSNIDKFTQKMGNAATFGLGDKAAALGEVAANRLNGNNSQDFSTQYQNALQSRLAQQKQFSQENPNESAVANVLGSVGSVPISKADIPATFIGKMIQGAKGGTALGAIAGEGKANDQSFYGDVSDIYKGAKFGGITGGLIPAAFGAGSGLVNSLTSHGISPEEAQLASISEDKYGIPISGAQLSNNQFVKYLASLTDKLPFSGAGQRSQEQSSAVTKAISNEILPVDKNIEAVKQFATPEQLDNLKNSSGLTTQYMSTARKVLGNMFNHVSDNTNINADSVNTLGDKLAAVSKDASDVLGDNVKPITNQINKILSTVQEDGTLSGQTYQALTRKGTPLDRLMSSSDPNVKHYASNIRESLDDALESSTSPENTDLLRQARYGWKNMKTVQDIAAKAGIEGEISPNLLLNAVKKSYKDLPYTGAGNMGEIARITQLMKEPGSSGTAERLASLDLLKAAGSPFAKMLGVGAVGGVAAANPLATAASAAGIVGGGKLANMALNSQAYKNMVLNSALNNPSAVGNFFQGATGPAAAQAAISQVNRLQPDKLFSPGSINQ